MPSREAEELGLLASLTAIALAREMSVFEMNLAGSFLSSVADQLFLLTVVLEEEEAQKDKKEAEKKAKAADERMAALEKAVEELKDLYGKAAKK